MSQVIMLMQTIDGWECLWASSAVLLAVLWWTLRHPVDGAVTKD